MDNNFNENNFQSNDFKREEPWYKKPSVTVDDGYNAYRDGQSVLEEAIEKSPGMFKGVDRLENEDAGSYYFRRQGEQIYLRNAAKIGLRGSSGYISLIILLYFAISYSLAAVEGVFSGFLGSLVTFLQVLFVFPAVIIVANIGFKHKTKTLFAKPEVSKFFVFKWSVIALGLTYAVSTVFNILFSVIQQLGVHVNDFVTPVPENIYELVFYFLSVVVCAPIFEEILFRGVLLTHHMKYGSWHAIIVTGVLFGLVHQNHEQLFFAAAIGVLFGYIDVKAGSVIPSVIAHMVVNGFSFASTLCLFFTNYNETLKDPSVMLDGPVAVLLITGILNYLVYAIMILSVVMLVYEISKNKKELELPKGDSSLTTSEKVSAFLSHPATITLLVLLVFMILVNTFVDVDAIMQMVEQQAPSN